MMTGRTFMIVLPFVLTGLNSLSQANSSFGILSPNRTTALEVKTAGGKLLYRMFFEGQPVTDWSQLGLQTNRSSGEEKIKISRKTQRSHKETFHWPLGEDDAITNNYNEIRFTCTAASSGFALLARVYD